MRCLSAENESTSLIVTETDMSWIQAQCLCSFQVQPLSDIAPWASMLIGYSKINVYSEPIPRLGATAMPQVTYWRLWWRHSRCNKWKRHRKKRGRGRDGSVVMRASCRSMRTRVSIPAPLGNCGHACTCACRARAVEDGDWGIAGTCWLPV